MMIHLGACERNVVMPLVTVLLYLVMYACDL